MSEILNEVLNEISVAVQRGEFENIEQHVSRALDAGVPALTILDEGLLAGMRIINDRFRRDEVFVPEVLVCARAMNAGTEILQRHLAETGSTTKGKCIIAAVKGDRHDIGKNLVKVMMKGNGIKVIDLGTDVEARDIVAKAKEENADIIALSALLTTSMPEIGAVVKEAEAQGIRDQVKIMVGGAPISEEFVTSIGADIYAGDAATAVNIAIELLG